jgi:putative endonuclease
MDKQYYVYIMTNFDNTVLYTGVTGNLIRRAHEHKNRLTDGFTKKYYTTKLVYFEVCNDVKCAIEREKEIKKGSRRKKVNLVNSMNQDWEDLSIEL